MKHCREALRRIAYAPDQTTMSACSMKFGFWQEIAAEQTDRKKESMICKQISPVVL
jgi:hypothetical protein